MQNIGCPDGFLRKQFYDWPRHSPPFRTTKMLNRGRRYINSLG